MKNKFHKEEEMYNIPLRDNSQKKIVAIILKTNLHYLQFLSKLFKKIKDISKITLNF